MKKIFYIVLLLLVSCNQRNGIIKEEHINKLSEGSYEMPSKYGGLSLFILSNDGDIIITNSDHLNYVYEKHYLDKNNTYKDFLIKVLNKNSKVDKKEFDNIPFKSFKIDSVIKKEYQESSFDSFVKKYTLKSKISKKALELNNNSKSYQELMTIAYYFYINGYQVQENDYSAKYRLIKRDEVFR
jgi:hypothetical protein